MKKRIAIFTTFRANNFGAALQAYALACKCREMGFDAELFDWRTPAFEALYFTPILTYRSFAHLVFHPRAFARFFVKNLIPQTVLRKRFARFRKRMPISKPCSKGSDLQTAICQYDICMVGSDQMWNPPITGIDWNPLKFDRTYLLRFANGKRRCAYATSMGKSKIEPESLVGEFVDAWKNFDAITMREAEGAKYVSIKTGMPVPQVLDPVFLFNEEFWRNEARDVHPRDPYVVVYNLLSSSWLMSCARNYVAGKGCRVVVIAIPAIPSSFVLKDGVLVGPDGFVDLIAHAEAVFSSSFHACAFSAIFKRRIFVNMRRRGGLPNSRFDSFADWTGVRGRVVDSHDDMELMEFDFSTRDDSTLDHERARSTAILKNMICGKVK